MAEIKPAERATLVILYVETRGFTRMSEILEPAVVLARISEFFVLVTNVVQRHDGTVRDLLNDNVVASFEGPACAPNAVEAAQEIQREFTALEEAWQRDVDLSAPLESWREDVAAGLRPATIFNATISDSGERLLMGTANPPEAPGRRNFERVFDWADVSIVTAARLSAAFPYVTPAARADNDEEASIHFVDGGYYDVYGVASLIDWLDDALRRNQRSDGVKIDRIMVLQLRGAPPDREKKGKRRGWFYQAYAPLSALLGARDTGQLAHNDQEISLLRRAWSGKVAISSAVFQFCGGSPPLSWHMTQPQKDAIEAQWSDERIHASTRAVMAFLTPSETDPVTQAAAPTSIPARCAPAEIEAESKD